MGFRIEVRFLFLILSNIQQKYLLIRKITLNFKYKQNGMNLRCETRFKNKFGNFISYINIL